MAGYSKRSLTEKLDLKAGEQGIIKKGPQGFAAHLLPLPGNFILKRTSATPVDYIHIFSKNVRELITDFKASKTKLKKTGKLWVSWPKKTSGITTDLNENIVREIGLELGLVDTKVAAIDDTWSALKFVYRLSER